MFGTRLIAATLLIVAIGAAEFPARADTGAAKRPLDAGVEVLTLEGRKQALSDFKGKVVVVNFWASWCFPCRYEMPLLQKMHDRFKDRGLTVVAIAVDDMLVDARAYQSEKRFTFPMLYDGEGVSKRAFGFDSVPETYIVGRDGKLAPFRDPRTGEVSTLITDPRVWEGEAIVAFLAGLVEE
jgi:thiol-disulfide isomerase/thioredoxin